ncbi:MAG: fumarate hydratase C-terminal domain-containing protein [Halobacteriota archaeon]
MSSELKTPIRPDDVRRFNVGDVVYISGVICTERDKAHAKMLSDPQRPFSLRSACIYHSSPLIVRGTHLSHHSRWADDECMNEQTDARNCKGGCDCNNRQRRHVVRSRSLPH